MAQIRFTVKLNGTETNPYHQFGLGLNPFPQLGRYEYAAQLLHLAKLGADPIPDPNYIRRHLRGWSEEFVEVCCSRFEKGKMVEFEVYFEE
jgi:hypothetical protein